MNILDTIVAQKRIEVAALPERRIAAGDLRDAMLERTERRDFMAALRAPRRGDVALIAEVKKASPSKGIICPTSTLSASRANTRRRARAACPC